MSVKPAVVLTALILLLLPIYLYFDRPELPAINELKQQQESLLKLDAIDGITLVRGDESIRYKKTADGKLYQLLQPANAFIPQDLMQAMAALLVNARQVEVVADNTNDLSQWGLDHPRSEMTIDSAGGQPIQIFFGSENPTHTAIYARIEGIPKVFLLGRNMEYYQSLMFQWVEGKQGKNA